MILSLAVVATAGAIALISAATHMGILGGGVPAGAASGFADGVNRSRPLHHLAGGLSRAMAGQCRHLVGAGGLPLLPGGGGVGVGPPGGGALAVRHHILHLLRLLDRK